MQIIIKSYHSDYTMLNVLNFYPSPKQLLGSNIPKGDQEKLVHKETTQVVSYPKPGSANYRVYRRDNALTRLGDTNYKVGHAKKYDKFETTAAQSFQLDQMPGMKKTILLFTCYLNITSPLSLQNLLLK